MTVRTESTRLRPWKVGIVLLVAHAVIVGILVSIRWLAFGGSAAWDCELILRICDFWVYRWVVPWFNDPVFARVDFEMYRLLGSSMRLWGAVYEWLMVSTCGGVVYALVGVVWATWWRRRRLHVLPSVAA